jgi:sensor histidine kinase YesM
LTLPDQIPDTSIPPLLFTSFVENAFKHGISYQNPTFIDIAFSYTTDYLIFEIRNINHRVKSENRTSGIGIDNARKRLDILYGKKYSLKIEDNIDDFVVILKIPV